MHFHSTRITDTERPTISTMTEKRPTKRQTTYRRSVTRDTSYTTPVDEMATISTVAFIPRSSRSNSRSDGSSSKGLSTGVIISSSIVAVLGVVALVIIIIILVRIWRKRGIRRNNVRTVRSNTQLSFGNMSYDGEGRQESAGNEVDMTDFEVMRSRMVSSIKRKVSVFSNSGKDNSEQDSHRISCGRLSIVETKYDNAVDLGEIVQTYQV